MTHAAASIDHHKQQQAAAQLWRTWARARRVESWLDARVDRLPRAARERLGYGFYGQPVLELLSAGETSLRAFMEERARLAEAGDGERRPLPAAAADDSARTLFARMTALHEAIAGETAPLPRRLVEEVRLRLVDAPPRVAVEMVAEGTRQQVELPLSPAAKLAGASCSCRAGDGDGRCVHALAALEALLEVLADPQQRAFSDRVAGAAGAPWQRLLGELGAAAVGAGGAAEPLALGWRLSLVGDGYRLLPVELAGKRTREVPDQRMLAECGRLEPVDRAAWQVLWNARHRFTGADDRSIEAFITALELLRGHPRLWFRAGQSETALEIRPGKLTLEVRPTGKGYELVPLVDGREQMVWLLCRSMTQSGRLFTVYPGRGGAVVTLVQVDRGTREALLALSKRGGELPAAAGTELARRAPELVSALPMVLPPRLLGTPVPADPRPVLRIEVTGEQLVARALVRPLPGAPAYPLGTGPLDVFVGRSERRYTRRDLGAEAALVRERLACLPLPQGADEWRLEGEAALDLVAALDRPGARDGLELEWPAQAPQISQHGKLSLSVRESRDWFQLDGECEVDGDVIALQALLEAMRAGRRYVRVGEGRWLELADALRARLGAIDDLAHERGRERLIPALAAPALAEQLGDCLADGPPRWQALLARARKALEQPPATPPPLAVTLRDYQVEGFRWASRLADWGAGACLADDMGLGKTIQALALLQARRKLGPALVVAPTSVTWNWVREAGRCAPGLRARLLSAERDRPAAIDAAGPGDVLVVSYGLLVRHAKALAARRFATLVLDEAQAVKNPGSRRARAAVELQAGFKLALTGTPIENRLSELWSLMRIVAPRLLGGWERFREQYAVPIERDGDRERAAALSRLVRPFLLRRVKAQVARELPAKTEIRVDVELDAEERRRYDALRLEAAATLSREARAAAASDQGEQRFQVLAALTRLRQLACHVGLVDEGFGGGSSKLRRMVELAGELVAEGHRALVFSQFTSLLGRARDALELAGLDCLYLDGATPESTRRDLVERFQAGEGQIFLISLKAGGTGLNLTGADNVIHLDPWWNPAVEDQATDRAHRIGQSRPVTVYRLVAADTVEEAILELHADKRRLVDGVMAGSDVAGALDAAQLMALIRHGAAQVEGVVADGEPGHSRSSRSERRR